MTSVHFGVVLTRPLVGRWLQARRKWGEIFELPLTKRCIIKVCKKHITERCCDDASAGMSPESFRISTASSSGELLALVRKRP